MTRPERDPEKVAEAGSVQTMHSRPCAIHSSGTLQKQHKPQALASSVVSSLSNRQRLFNNTELSNLNNLSKDPAKGAGFLCSEGRCNCCWHQRSSKLPSDSGGGSGGLGSLGALTGGSAVGVGAGSQCSSSESLDGGIMSLLPLSPEVREAIESVKYIAENMRLQNEAKEVSVHNLLNFQGHSDNVTALLKMFSL